MTSGRIASLIRRGTRLSLLLAVVLLLCSVGAIATLLRSQQWVSQSYEVMLLDARLRDAVHVQRMRLSIYSRTAEPAALSDFRGAVDESSRLFDQLRTTAAGNPAQQALVARTRAIWQERLALSERAIARRRAGSEADAIAVIRSRGYVDASDALDTLLDTLSSTERGVLSERLDRQHGMLAVLAMLLGGFVLFLTFLVVRVRHAAQAALAELDRAHQAEAESRAELAAGNDASPLGLVHLDLQGHPTYLNARFRELIGAAAGENDMASWNDSLHPEDRPQVLAAWQRMRDEHVDAIGTYRVLRPDGTRAWVATHMVPLRVNGEVRGFVGMSADVTTERNLRNELRHSHERLQKITDTVPALIAYVDANQVYHFVNATYPAWFGADGAPQPGDTIQSFLGDAYVRVLPYVERVLAGETAQFEVMQRNLHGRDLLANVTYTPDIDARGRVAGFTILVTDLTERKAMEDGLFAAKEQLQVTLDALGDAVITTDAQARIEYLNPRAQALIEHGSDAVRGLALTQAMRVVDAHGEPSATSLPEAIRENRVVDTQARRKLVLSDGAVLDIEDVASPLRNKHGEVVGGVLIVRDVSVAQAAADRLRHMAEHDALTDLPNRVLLEDRARQALLQARRRNGKAALLYVDLDDFKTINDTHGHSAGDAVLREVAVRLRHAVRSSDTVCRLGGDEFVVLLPDVADVEAACLVAEKIVAAGRAPVYWQREALFFSFSVGVAVYPDHGGEVPALMRSADQALYDAKEAGRDCFVCAGGAAWANPRPEVAIDTAHLPSPAVPARAVGP